MKWPAWLLYGNQSIHFHCKTTQPVSIWQGHVMMLRSGLFDFMMLRNFKRFFYTAARPLLCIEKQLTGFSVKKTHWYWDLFCFFDLQRSAHFLYRNHDIDLDQKKMDLFSIYKRHTERWRVVIKLVCNIFDILNKFCSLR